MNAEVNQLEEKLGDTIIVRMNPTHINNQEREKIKQKLLRIVIATFGTDDPRFADEVERFAFGVDNVYFIYHSQKTIDNLIGFAGFRQEGNTLVTEGMAIDPAYTRKSLGKRIHELEIRQTGASMLVGYTQTPYFYALVKSLSNRVEHEIVSNLFGRRLHSTMPHHKDQNIMTAFNALYANDVRYGSAIKVIGHLETFNKTGGEI